MKIAAIIPARMASSRFPGKPLAPILGLSMIEHVRRRVSMCERLDEVIVATCDEEIREAVESSGGKVIMTANTHERCTDRIAEAAEKINADIVVNVQGDEVLILPEMLDDVIKPMVEDMELPAVNLVTRIEDETEFQDRNAPKVVANKFGNLLYISREPIPSRSKADSNDYLKQKQLGVIAFRNEFLRTFLNLEPTPLEIVESVDMMRAVEHGYRIRIVETIGKMIAVDVPGDIEKVERALATDHLVNKYL